MLRIATVVIFGVATVIGVSLALAAPTESPVSLSEPAARRLTSPP